MALWDIFTPKTATKLVDGIYNGIDMVIYTPEEKAKAYQLATETKLKMLPQFEAFKLAQRYLAFTFTLNFILAFWAAVLIWWIGTDKQLEEYLNIVAVFQLGWIMLTIVGFYYSGGFVESYKRSKG